jgi:electron transfer flavoprotein beta subunit
MKRVAVLVSAGRHPVSGEPRHCRNDSLALQLGLNLIKDLTVLHAGEADNPALQDYLAFGAHHIDVVSTAGDSIENLATHLSNADLILTGTRAENGENSGLLPYLLAAKLNLPIVAGALEILPRDRQLEVLQFLPKGQRRRVMVQLPAVVAIHPLAPVKLHYIHARKGLESIATLATSNTTAGTMQWRTGTPRKPVKLKAPLSQTGHERLMAAITSKNKGGSVVNEGNCVEKAQVIINFLREHRFINY